jgi:hypothetical protein
MNVVNTLYISTMKGVIDKPKVTIGDIRLLYPKILLLRSYAENYEGYEKLVNYSKITPGKRILMNKNIESYTSEARSICKKFDKISREHMFETLRENLVDIDTFSHAIDMWTLNEKQIKNLRDVQHVLNDIKFFYPDIMYSSVKLENQLYRLIGGMRADNVDMVYIPPRSNAQFKVVIHMKDKLIELISHRYGRDSEEDIDGGVTINSIVNTIKDHGFNDTDVYDLLTSVSHNIDQSTPKDEVIGKFTRLMDTKQYKTLQDLGPIKILDLGSRDMLFYASNIADMLKGEGDEISSIELTGLKLDRNLYNIIPEDVSEMIDIDLGVDRFSIITAMMILHMIPDAVDKLKQLSRSLRKGGLLVVEEYEVNTDTDRVFADIDKILEIEPSEKDQYIKELESGTFYMSDKQWEFSLKGIGFNRISGPEIYKYPGNMKRYSVYEKSNSE